MLYFLQRIIRGRGFAEVTSDSLYHRLFSHPLMVEQLVQEFVPEGRGLDFSRMERVNAKFHARRGRRREGDVIWRIPIRNGEADVSLYILLEFQSKADWWMVIRVMVYVGLLWQYIIREKKLKRGDALPPVLPLVLYNGDHRWNAPTDLSGLIALPHPSGPGSRGYGIICWTKGPFPATN